LLVTELLDAYPEAQVMLTTRDVDKWVYSMKSTLLHSRTVPGRESRGTERLRDAVDVNWDHDFDANGAAFFLAHNQKVRDEVAKRGRPLLELDVSQPDSFAKMCEFLGKEMPGELTEFPRSDEWLAYKKKHGTGGYEKEASAV
jgi:Sulfotransferase domain